MQKKRIDDPKSKDILQDVLGRIKSLALIHEKLQTSDKLDQIDMNEYLKSLLKDIKNTYKINNFSYELKCSNTAMNISQVTSIGLIINELASNSFKHAFKDINYPKIVLLLQETTESEYVLNYSDNGVLSSSIDDSQSLDSLLINTLSRSQLKGKILVKTEPSLSYQIIFPKQL